MGGSRSALLRKRAPGARGECQSDASADLPTSAGRWRKDSADLRPLLAALKDPSREVEGAASIGYAGGAGARIFWRAPSRRGLADGFTVETASGFVQPLIDRVQ